MLKRTVGRSRAGWTIPKRRNVMTRALSCCLTLVGFIGVPSAFADLVGVDVTTGTLYSVSESNGSLSAIGNTGITGAWADITYAPGGTLYGFTDSAATTPTLYTINPTTAATTPVGPLNIGFVFEGGLAITPGGVAYGMNTGANSSAGLFNINLSTGVATAIGTVTGATDINGLVYRSDGMLIGLDDNTNSLLVINPVTLTSAFLAAVPTSVGAVGGMTIDKGVGYYITAGPSLGGSDALYSFNLFSGASTLVGNLGLTDGGLSGLAAPMTTVPEPSEFWVLAALFLIGAFVAKCAQLVSSQAAA